MDKLIHCRCLRPNAKVNLFCFPWLGGGSLFYAKWFQILPENIEVNSIRLPGRENRYQDTPYTDIEDFKENVCQILLPKLKEKPFIIFGHSLGALLSYAIATHLKQQHNLEPQHLFISGTSCPQSPKRKSGSVSWASLSDDELIDRIGQLGGTPPEVLSNKGLMMVAVKAFRADSQLLDNYEDHVPHQAVLTCPMSFFDGDKDREHDYQGWGVLTSGAFTSQMLPGGHFYLYKDTNSRKIADHIIQNTAL